MMLKKFNVVREEYDPVRIEKMKRDGYEEYPDKEPVHHPKEAIVSKKTKTPPLTE